jgi:peroxiredoxin Q/BCP
MQIFHRILPTGLASVLLALQAGAEPLEVGAAAPAITVTIENGDAINLADVYEEGPVLFYFYPKSFTGGCTKQACNLRDNFPDITDSGITVFGVSGDGVETQEKFRAEYNLPFHLVADTEASLIEAFGVPYTKPNKPSRQSFLVVDGVIVWRDLKADPSTQAQDALEAFRGID